MIDPVTSWFEICVMPLDDAGSERKSTPFCDFWLCRYPRPTCVTCDNGSEFKKCFHTLCKEHELNEKPTTVKNPQSNGIVERAHQVIGNMLRGFELGLLKLDEADPFGKVLARIGWAMRSTYHAALQATPGPLVFGRDMLFDADFTADWHNIYQRKQNRINKNNVAENLKQLEHTCQVGDHITIRAGAQDKINKIDFSNKGPYSVVQVFTNSCVRVRRGHVEETLNIRCIDPYYERASP